MNVYIGGFCWWMDECDVSGLPELVEFCLFVDCSVAMSVEFNGLPVRMSMVV